jgi:hypothetical protein
MKQKRVDQLKKEYEDKGVLPPRYVFEMLRELEEANRRIQFLGELANVCTHMDTGLVCPYCKCERGVG